MVGKEDRVEQCMYAAVITRIEEDLDDELTGGWKIVEVSFSIFGERLVADHVFRWPVVLLVHTCDRSCDTFAVPTLLFSATPLSSYDDIRYNCMDRPHTYYVNEG
jgi:hypothetical protein